MTEAKAPADKQQQVLTSFISGVSQALGPEFKAMAEMLAEQRVTLGAIEARLAALEGAGGAAPAGKRGVRTAAAKTAGAGPNITNALLFFRFALATNHDGMRARYADEARLDQVNADASMAKKNRETDPETYYRAAAAVIWRAYLDEAAKTAVRTSFKAWQEDRTRATADPALEEEGGADPDADADAEPAE